MLKTNNRKNPGSRRRTLKTRLAMLSISPFLLLSLSCVQSSPGHPSTPRSNKGDLTATYIFELVGAGIEKSNITVNFEGHLISTTAAADGRESFNQNVTAEKLPTRPSFGPGCEVTHIETSQTGLRPGMWKITGDSGLVAGKVSCEIEVKPGGTNSASLNTCHCDNTPATCCTPIPPQQGQSDSQHFLVQVSSTVMLSDNSEQMMLQVRDGSIEIERSEVLNNVEISLGDITAGGFATGSLAFKDVKIRNLAVGFADFRPGSISAIADGSVPFELSFNFNGQLLRRTIVPSHMSTVTNNDSLQLAAHLDLLPDPSDPLASSLRHLSRFVPSSVDMNIIASLGSPSVGECIRSKPTVVIDPATQSAFAGRDLTYYVTVTNNDSAECPVSTFTGMADFPEADFQHLPLCFRVTLGPGQSAKRRITIVSPGKSCIGPKRFRETVTNDLIPGLTGSASAVFEVVPIVPNCSRVAPIVTVEAISSNPMIPNRPPNETFLGGQITYKVTVTNNDSSACGWSEFLITPTFPDPLITQTPANLHLWVPPGGGESRPVVIKPSLFTLGRFDFVENANHLYATCLAGSAIGSFRIAPLISGVTICCQSEQMQSLTGTTQWLNCQAGTAGNCTGIELDCTVDPVSGGTTTTIDASGTGGCKKVRK